MGRRGNLQALDSFQALKQRCWADYHVVLLLTMTVSPGIRSAKLGCGKSAGPLRQCGHEGKKRGVLTDASLRLGLWNYSAVRMEPA